jgi:glutaredoxin
MSIIRWLLARIIFIVDLLFRPRKYKHSNDTQAEYDTRTKSLTLYQFAACPFCVKVRWAIRRLGLSIAYRDAKRNAQYAKELVEGGGHLKVPCLRIEKGDGNVEWMYESSDIIAYLSEHYPKQS